MTQSAGYTKIRENLYLGTVKVAIDGPILTQLSIRRVLTLREFGIDSELKFPNILYMHLPISDTRDDDLLSHFLKCHQFIEEGRKHGQSVLVHCRLGVSRSATVVISYLMGKYRISCDEALQRVQKKRPVVRPNSGFYRQLKLFEEMEFRYNALNPKFRLYLLKRWLLVKKNQIECNVLAADSTIIDSFFSILSLSSEAEGQPISCKKCNKCLFREIHVIRDLTLENKSFRCSHIYSEPQKWMLDQISANTRGLIVCYQCQTQVGAYNWQFLECNCILHSKITPYLVFRFNSMSVKGKGIIGSSPKSTKTKK